MRARAAGSCSGGPAPGSARPPVPGSTTPSAAASTDRRSVRCGVRVHGGDGGRPAGRLALRRRVRVTTGGLLRLRVRLGGGLGLRAGSGDRARRPARDRLHGSTTSAGSSVGSGGLDRCRRPRLVGRLAGVSARPGRLGGRRRPRRPRRPRWSSAGGSRHRGDVARRRRPSPPFPLPCRCRCRCRCRSRAAPRPRPPRLRRPLRAASASSSARFGSTGVLVHDQPRGPGSASQSR